MLIENINYLRKHYRQIRDYFKENEEMLLEEPIEMVQSKTGIPTLQVHTESGSLLLHSKYNPEQEAERLVQKYKDEMDQYQHVLFYGVGLGYHVEAFLKEFPNISFSLYEPSPAIFYHYLSTKRLESLPVKQLTNLYLETSSRTSLKSLVHHTNELNGNMLLVPLPSYERVFKESYQTFLKQFKKSMQNKKFSFHTNLAFEKRWTVNSMKNFPKVIKTPNILHKKNEGIFKDNPVIIVSAGPSLNDELENLKYIKQNRLAYIFAVGSANKTLIKHGIIPDAVCSYDPKAVNYLVVEEIKTNKIDIPLIFGSSVGFETLENYPGPKIHFITSQDTVSGYYLDEDRSDYFIVDDAPSIAIITFQILSRLKASTVILVGQNLAYRDNRFYSSGIEYEGRSTSVSKSDLDKAMTVKDVQGKEVLTNESFLRMKSVLEYYISKSKMNVINTTKGGAAISGTIFESLEEVINQKLTNAVVDEKWYHDLNYFYNVENIWKRQSDMDKARDEIGNIMDGLTTRLRQIEYLTDRKQSKELEKEFVGLDKEFKKLRKNIYYRTFLHPMLRVPFEFTEKKVKNVKFEHNQIVKGTTIVRAYSRFIYECKKTLNQTLPFYQELESTTAKESVKGEY
ncbi:motility associated factor glycosyltransferase family protein [Virgibacillus senegalensis]|uniref:motility associated factor glycosyltransferase family protein n=1 Tax=Virgibacillus senegalensis TaxID=1499679 RepID=UPI00069EE649|nr:6-hydroxymethylpterin diphosphokinase MptE-like protein [Virgibacillus senegalensis]